MFAAIAFLLIGCGLTILNVWLAWRNISGQPVTLQSFGAAIIVICYLMGSFPETVRIAQISRSAGAPAGLHLLVTASVVAAVAAASTLVILAVVIGARGVVSAVRIIRHIDS